VVNIGSQRSASDPNPDTHRENGLTPPADAECDKALGTGLGDRCQVTRDRSGSLKEQIALGGGELTWRAGPLEKGGGLCHGTSGNGYAFLVLF
jgi:hypothetical protein